MDVVTSWIAETGWGAAVVGSAIALVLAVVCGSIGVWLARH